MEIFLAFLVTIFAIGWFRSTIRFASFKADYAIERESLRKDILDYSSDFASLRQSYADLEKGRDEETENYEQEILSFEDQIEEYKIRDTGHRRLLENQAEKFAAFKALVMPFVIYHLEHGFTDLDVIYEDEKQRRDLLDLVRRYRTENAVDQAN